MKVITTLTEKKYFVGLAALINSIIKQGTYVDKVVVGYRDALPAWLPTLASSNNGQQLILQTGLIIEFVLLNGSLHMVHEKPTWFKYLTDVLEPEATEFFFFDSDIIVLRRMNFYGEWVKEGVALCEDVNFDMSNNHPIRKQWTRLALDNNIKIVNCLNKYYNSGFLGWTRHTAKFVSDWEKCFQVLAKESGDMKKFRVHDRTFTVLSANQDSLNLAAMVTNLPISTIGPEAMGFMYGMNLMSHPIGKKPWDRKYIAEFLTGSPPRTSDINFWLHLKKGALKPYSLIYVNYKLFLCKLLRGCGRFYKSLNDS